jgi:site-specific DNA recombinase
VLSRESRSSEKFMHGIKVLMAKNYVDNLSEETRKGMLEKAEHGVWPSFAPLGYRNVASPDGRKIINPDPEAAPIVTKLFGWYATGLISAKEATKKARAAALNFRKSGAHVQARTIQYFPQSALYGPVRLERQALSGQARVGCLLTCGNECRQLWMVATPRSQNKAGEISRSLD